MSPQDANTFDYIVAGAGAAGCVIANRLSAKSDQTVLLLEAGGSDEFFTSTRMLDLASLFSLWTADTDWGYSTEPIRGANGRAVPITQGKVLGAGARRTAESTCAAIVATTTAGINWATRGGATRMFSPTSRRPKTTPAARTSTTE